MRRSKLLQLLLPAGALAAALLAEAGQNAAAARAGETAPPFTVASLPDSELQRLHRSVAPGKERWAEIPWETDLAAARARAAREGRPLLMWIMDGHPLGCT